MLFTVYGTVAPRERGDVSKQAVLGRSHKRHVDKIETLTRSLRSCRTESTCRALRTKIAAAKHSLEVLRGIADRDPEIRLIDEPYDVRCKIRRKPRPPVKSCLVTKDYVGAPTRRRI